MTVKKTYKQIVEAYLYGPGPATPSDIGIDTSPREAYRRGWDEARRLLLTQIDDAKGLIEPLADKR